MNPDFGTPSLSFVETFSGVGEWPASTELIPPQDFSSGVSTSFVEDFSGAWSASTELIPPQDFSSGVSTSFTEDFSGVWPATTELIPPYDFSTFDLQYLVADFASWSASPILTPAQENNPMAKRLYLKAPAGGGNVLISDVGLMIPEAETDGILVSCSDEESLDAAAGERILLSSSEVRASKTLLALLENGTLLMKRAAADSYSTSANLAEPFASEELMTADLADQQVVMTELEVVTSIKSNSVETDSVNLDGSDLGGTLTGHAGRLTAEEAATAAATTDRALIRSDQVAADAAAKIASDAYSDQSEADAESAASADATSKSDQALVDAKAYSDQSELDAISTSGTNADAKVLVETNRALGVEATNTAALGVLNHASNPGSVAKAVADEATRASTAEAANATALGVLNHASNPGSVAASVDAEKTRAEAAAAAEKTLRENAEAANATNIANNTGNIQAGAELFFYPNGVSDYKALLTSLGASVGSGSLIDATDDNKTAIDAVVADIGAASTANTVKGDIKALEDADAVLIADIDVLEVAKASHNSRLNTAEADINALESASSTTVTNVSNLSASNAGLTGVVTGNHNITLANQSGLSVEVAARAAADVALASDISDVDTRVDNIMHLTTDPSLDSLKEIVDAFQTSDASTSGTLLSIQADINSNEADADAGIAAVQADVDAKDVAQVAALAAVIADVAQNETDADAASLAAQTKANANEASIAALEGDQIAISIGASEPYLALYAGMGATSAKDYLELNAQSLAAGGNAFIGAAGMAAYLAAYNGGNAAPAGSAFGQIEQNKSDISALVADVAQNETDSDAGIAAAASAALIGRNALQADIDQNESDADAAILAVQNDVDANQASADASISALIADVAQNESDSDAGIAAEATARATADTNAAALSLAARQAIQADIDQNESDSDSGIATVQADVDANELAANTSIAAEAATAAAATAAVAASLATEEAARAAAVTAAEAAAASALASEKAVQDAARAALILEHRSLQFSENGYCSYMHLKAGGSAIPSNSNSPRFSADSTVSSYSIGLGAVAAAATSIKVKLIDDAGAVKAEQTLSVQQGASYTGGSLSPAMSAAPGDRLAVEVTAGLVSDPIVTLDFSKDL